MIDDDLVVAGQSADEQPSAAPEKQPDTKEQPRAKDGKFAGKEAGEQAAESQEVSRDEGGKQIPIQALDAEKARRRKAEQENFQLKGYLQALERKEQQQPITPEAPKPKPDWYVEPDAAFKARFDEEWTARQKTQEPGLTPRQVLEINSRLNAIDRHGPEVVNAAWEAANERMNSDPAFNAAMKARLQHSDHPYSELIKWHSEQSTLARLGGKDLDAFLEEQRQAWLAENPQGQLPTGSAQQRAPVLPERLPADFSNARNAGGRGQPAYGGPKSLDELYGR